jgi:hypothetical protein
MKRVKKVCALIFVLTIVMSLCACGKASSTSKIDEALQGDWQTSWPSLVGTCYIYLHFDNGNVRSSSMALYESQSEGTYAIDEDAHTITCTWTSFSTTADGSDDYIPSPDVYDYTFENDTLSIVDYGDGTFVQTYTKIE